MSEWITDRKPRGDEGPMIYGPDGKVCHTKWIGDGDPWKPIPKCEPYVKPKRWKVSSVELGNYVICDTKFDVCIRPPLPTREAAERIAAIYEEVFP